MADKFGVKNTGQYVYKEKFDGKEIVIEPGQTIKMNRGDAVKFMSNRPPGGIKTDGGGQLKPESIKALQLIREEPTDTEYFVSPRNGERYLTKEAMEEEDSKFDKQKVSANEQACHFCDFTSSSMKVLYEHTGKEHANDRSGTTKPSPVAV